MRKSTWIWWPLFFLNIMVNLIFPQEKVTADSSAMGILTLLNTDSTKNIFIDEKFVGKGAIQSLSIPAGKHLVQVTPMDRNVWRVGDWKKEFVIAAGESLSIEIPPVQYFYINSIPFDAAVIINDSLIGKTPLFTTIADPGPGVLRIKMTGYTDFLAQIKDLKTNYLQIHLQKDTEIDKINLQKALNLKRKKMHRKILTYSMVGLTLLSGVTTIHLRQEADQRYDQYLAAGKPAVMNQFYQKTQEYDRYAAITYGTFQVSFISSLYFLFRK